MAPKKGKEEATAKARFEFFNSIKTGNKFADSKKKGEAF